MTVSRVPLMFADAGRTVDHILVGGPPADPLVARRLQEIGFLASTPDANHTDASDPFGAMTLSGKEVDV